MHLARTNSTGGATDVDITNDTLPCDTRNLFTLQNVQFCLQIARVAAARNPVFGWIGASICCIGTIGNSLALRILYKNKGFQRKASFVYHRAIYWSDLLFVGFALIREVIVLSLSADGDFPLWYNVFHDYLYEGAVVPVLAKFSDFVILAVAADRALAMAVPFFYKKHIDNATISIRVALVTFACSVPFGIIHFVDVATSDAGHKQDEEVLSTHDSSFYTYGIIPVVLLATELVLAGYTIYFLRRRKQGKTTTGNFTKNDDQESILMVRLMVALVLVYAACDIPFITAMALYPDGDYLPDDITRSTNPSEIKAAATETLVFIRRSRLLHIAMLGSHSFRFFAFVLLSPKFRAALAESITIPNNWPRLKLFKRTSAIQPIPATQRTAIG